MRTLLVIVIAAVGIGLLIKRGGGPAAKEAKPATVASTPAAPTTRQPSEHNWPKRSLDRAAEVKRQVAAQRASDGVR
jgi:hypothetical protein